MESEQKGFTLIEIAIVLLIVSILLGYTVALLPKRQELKQFRAAEHEMDEIIATLVGFAQVNGRLPCPAIPDSVGVEDGDGVVGCNNFGGFVPVSTIGFEGRLNGDTLLLDPWGNPYRYYVSNSDNGGNAGADFVVTGDMRTVGLVDADADTFIDLDGVFHICNEAHPSDRDVCKVNGGDYDAIFGRADATKNSGPYGGAPFLLISHGRDLNEVTATGDQLVNLGNSKSLSDLGMPNGLLGVEYTLREVTSKETAFVKRRAGVADDFDDIVKWVSPVLFFRKMIDAGQLP